jgi:hypothetical protein
MSNDSSDLLTPAKPATGIAAGSFQQHSNQTWVVQQLQSLEALPASLGRYPDIFRALEIYRVLRMEWEG